MASTYKYLHLPKSSAYVTLFTELREEACYCAYVSNAFWMWDSSLHHAKLHFLCDCMVPYWWVG